MPEELSVTNVVHSLQRVVMIVGVGVVVVRTEVEEVEVMKTTEVEEAEEVTIMMVAVVAVAMDMMVEMAEVVRMVVIKEGMMVVMDRVLQFPPPLPMGVLVGMRHLTHMLETLIMLLMQSLHLQVTLGDLTHTLHHMAPLPVMVVIVTVIIGAVDEVVHLVDMVEAPETQEVMAVLQQRLLRRSSSVTRRVGIPVITQEFTYQICLRMSPPTSSENCLGVSAK